MRQKRIEQLKSSIKSKEKEIRKLRSNISKTRSGLKDSELFKKELIRNQNENPFENIKNFEKSNQEYQQKLNILFQKIYSNKLAGPFKNAVTEDEAPGYFQVIKNPIDLSIIKNKILNGSISTKNQLMKILRLMFQNALLFNPQDSDLHILTKRFQAYVINESNSIFGVSKTRLRIRHQKSLKKVY